MPDLRVMFAAALLVVVPSAARAQPATSQAAPAASAPEAATASPLERANADAVAKLYAQIAAERVDGTPLSTLIDRVDGRDRLMDGLARAEQVGGPRTVADGFVQVRLEIDGARAADLVVRAVAAAADRSPIPPQRLATLLAPWSQRSFRSTGDSAPALAAAVENVAPATGGALPDVAPAWIADALTASAVGEPAGTALRTARAAERSARQALRTQIERLALDEDRSITALGEAGDEAIDLAVAAAKISGVDYRADGRVEVRVSVDGRQLWHALQLTAGPD